MSEKIYIVVFNLKTQGLNEAIKKEAFVLYKTLKDLPAFKNLVEFVSIENNSIEPEFDSEIKIIPLKDIYTFFQKNPPLLIHFFIPFLKTFFLFPDILNYQVIATLSGGNPIKGLGAKQLEEIGHVIDNGNLYPVVQSDYSKQKFTPEKFREIFKIYPYPVRMHNEDVLDIDIERTSKIKIGFASSPYDRESFKDRGVNIIKKLAAQYSDEIEFVIPWRNENLDFYAEGEDQLDNVQIFKGLYNMQNFYQNVDIVFLPYTNRADTHALPFSLLEAFMNQVPVISTRYVAALNELLSCNSVEVFEEQQPQLFMDKVNNLLANKNKFTNNGQLFLKEYCDKNSYLQKYVRLYNISAAQLPVLSLQEWKKACENSGTELVKGIDEMKKYYEAKEVSVEYSRQRFSKPPYDSINRTEQQAVAESIKKYANRNDLRLIDLSSGDGRMLKVLQKYGYTVAADNSEEMHSVSAQLNSAIDNNIRRVVADSFHLPFRVASFDVVICFRFLRHFEYETRRRVYRAIKKILNDDAIFVFDAPMKNTEAMIRYQSNWGSFNIYDVFYSDYSLGSEMYQNNFEILHSVPCGENIINESPSELSRVVTVKKRADRATTTFFESDF